MLTYKQSTGALSDENGVIGLGYSGNGNGLNNPAMEDVHNVGPIPRGLWSMVELITGPYKNKGPDVIRLEPNGFDPHGRSGFLCHGDNAACDHSASEGCIIMARGVRNVAWSDPDKTLEVVA